MSVQFADTIALLLLALLVPVLFWARRSIAGLGRARAITAIAIRSTIVVLLVLSLAEAQWLFKKDDLSVIYVLDQSLSIPTDVQRGVLDYVRESEQSRRSADTVGLVLFGGSAALERRADTAPLMDTPRPPAENGETQAAGRGEPASLQSVVNTQRTDIASGLRLALAALAPSGRKRIVLVSDGNENAGAAIEEAETARRNGVRIDVVPVRYQYTSEVMVEKVVAPGNVEKEATFEVRTVITANRPQAATLRLYENGVMILSQRVQLHEGRNVFVVQRQLAEPGYYSYQAQIESADDMLYANNSASAFTMVRGKGRVLYVEGDPERAGAFLEALDSQGLDVRMVGVEALPLTIGEIVPHDTLILSGIPAGAMGQDGMRAVELAVKDWGVGLVMIGSENSFGPGGYQDSPVERALPVSMEIKHQRVIPGGALVVILHTCEIPQGNYWARQIANAALRVLSSVDEFGIIYYDWQGGDKWLFKLQPVADKRMMASLIAGVQPGDCPSFIPPFQMAHKALNQSNASIKHVVVISDGDPQYPGDAELLKMVGDGITISAVGINPHSQTDTNRLAHVASIGKGNYYQPQNPSVLPQIFIKEASTVRRSQIFEEPFTPRVGLVSEIIKGIGFDEYPTLQGYVLTTPKELAEVALITQHDDPLLAHWQYGLGRSVAFTSDAQPRWAAQWLGWGKFEQFWAQAMRWVGRSIADARVSARAVVEEDRGHLILDAIGEEGQFMNGLDFTGVLITPDGGEVPVQVQQTGPGRYEANFDADDAGTHYLSLHYTDEEGRTALYTQGIVVPYSSEYRQLSTNERLLERIAEVTSGRVLARGDDVFDRTDFAPESRRSEAWPLLAFIAIALVPADIFVRRVFIDYAAAWARAAAWLAAVMPVGPEARRRRARPTHVSALLSSKRSTRAKLAMRAKKFEASPEREEAGEPTLAPDASLGRGRRPVIEAAEPPTRQTQRPAVSRDEDSYMGRLLRAKKEAEDEAKKRGDAQPPPSQAEE